MAKKPVPSKSTALLSTVDELKERLKDFPAIEALSRQFNDPNDPGTLPILLKDEQQACCLSTDHQYRLRPGATKCHLCKLPARKWHLHWCNTEISGKWSTMKHRAYIPVLIADLQDSQDISDLTRQKEDSGEIYVRRGDRGKEVLMKQPLEGYNYRKAKQAAERNARAKNAKLVRQDLAEQVGANLSDEAGNAIHSGAISVESMSRSRTTLAEEAGE